MKYEPLSVLLYEYLYETTISDFGCIQHDKHKFLGASPDGINTKPNNFLYGRMLEIKNIVNQGIKINIIGEINSLRKDIKYNLKKTIKLTKNNRRILVNLAINYGSKNEILQAINKIKKQKINTKNLESNLYTNSIPDPDILIRTGGYQRLSNFLLWQLAYTEIFFLKKLWPDFNNFDFNKIIKNYLNIKRNFGSIQND